MGIKIRIRNTLINLYAYIQKELDRNENPYPRDHSSDFQGIFNFLDDLEDKVITFFAENFNKKEIEKRFLKSLEHKIYPIFYNITGHYKRK